MLRHVLDQSRDCIKILGPEGTIEYVNSEGRCALGVPDPAAIRGKSWPELWPDESKPAIETAVQKAQAGEGSEVEAWRPDPRGDKRWWRISVSPLLEGNEELAGILTISRDITSHVSLRESEQTLALEMSHRLRNAYTVASAIVMQSARNDAALQSFADSVCRRLTNVALSQTRLLEAGRKSWTVAELIGTLVEAHEGSNCIRCSGPANAAADAREAMLIALVVGELTNNSLKYGALRDHEDVSLSWTSEDRTLALHWREPLAADYDGFLRPRGAGSGYSMMQRMARSQRAAFERVVADGELKVTLTLPRETRNAFGPESGETRQ